MSLVKLSIWMILLLPVMASGQTPASDSVGKGTFRSYHHILYHIEDTAGLVIYNRDSIQTDVNAQTLWMPVSLNSASPWGLPFTFYSVDEGKAQLYYFSKSFSSEIFPLTTENLVAQVPTPAFDKAVQKEFRWYNYKIYDKDKHGFIVNELYRRYCK